MYIMNNNDENREYVVYDYLKKNPSVLISCISAVVLVVSFILKGLIYVNECRYLKYWHLDEYMIDVSASNRIYEYVALGFFYIMTLVYFRLVEAMMEKKQARKLLIACERICLRSIKKVKKKQSEKNEEVERLINGGADVKKYKEYRKKICRGDGIIRCIIFTITVVGFIFVLYLFELFCGLSMSIGANVIVAIIMTVIPALSFYLSGEIVNVRREKKEYKKLSVEEQVEKYLQLMQIYKMESSVRLSKKTKGFDVKNLFRKSQIKLLIIYAVVLLVCMIGVIDEQGRKSLEQKKAFEIVEHDDMCYAIVYRDEEFIYLEEAEIIEISEKKENGETIETAKITIWIDCQRRLKADDICSEYRVFDSVVPQPGKREKTIIKRGCNCLKTDCRYVRLRRD